MNVALDALRELNLFAHLGRETQMFLAQRLQPRSFAPGEYIFRRGDPGGELYLVTSGEVELFVTKNSGEKLVLETVGARGFFGEVSLLDGEARSADAVAVAQTETLRLDRDALQVLFAQHPTSAFELIGQVTRRLRQANALLRHTAAPSPNETIEERATPFQRFADWLAQVGGTLPFLLVHFVWFVSWVLINLRVVPIATPFDPFPFGLLTMVVSLEAIFLSCVVLISQNRQAARDRIRSDAEYEANIRSALEVTHLHVKLDHFEDMVISRLDALQRAGGSFSGRPPVSG
jgi:CRP/FNR family transcriptional regulator, cyclic AMP receptor protein